MVGDHLLFLGWNLVAILLKVNSIFFLSCSQGKLARRLLSGDLEPSKILNMTPNELKVLVNDYLGNYVCNLAPSISFWVDHDIGLL